MIKVTIYCAYCEKDYISNIPNQVINWMVECPVCNKTRIKYEKYDPINSNVYFKNNSIIELCDASNDTRGKTNK